MSASSSAAHALKSNHLPPAQPVYILRGHSATIHSLTFLRHNTRLLSGDADGWIVLWSLLTKRPVAVWKAHDSTILGTGMWGGERIVTHGRDGKICVWALNSDDEATLSTQSPVEDTSVHRKQPWLLHMLEVPTINFCSFASCASHVKRSNSVKDMNNGTSVNDISNEKDTAGLIESAMEDDTLLIATSGSTDSQIELYQLPGCKQVGMIPAPNEVKGKTGMVMALHILHTMSLSLIIIVGYENGRTSVFKRTTFGGQGQWEQTYTSQPHSQPILSLDIDWNLGMYFTSAADAIIARHPFQQADTTPSKDVQTKHSGQQGLRVRNDGKIFATAGWDSRVRVYSAKTLKELAVLKWHKEGCYAVAFGDILDSSNGSSHSTQRRLEGGHLVRQTVSQRRETKAQSTHWLAAGSKDGKISLWEIY